MIKPVCVVFPFKEKEKTTSNWYFIPFVEKNSFRLPMSQSLQSVFPPTPMPSTLHRLIIFDPRLLAKAKGRRKENEVEKKEKKKENKANYDNGDDEYWLIYGYSKRNHTKRGTRREEENEYASGHR